MPKFSISISKNAIATKPDWLSVDWPSGGDVFQATSTSPLPAAVDSETPLAGSVGAAR